MPVKINLTNPLFQSPYSYLQAAGSNGSDGSAAGIHLRWDFLRTLGDEHMAKGNLSTVPPYSTTSGFNKTDDYINIYRVAYNNEYTVIIDFSQAPDTIVDTTTNKEWDYTGFTPVPFDTNVVTDVKVKFLDVAEYDTLKATVDPSLNPLDFVKQYTGIMEISTVGKLMFKGKFDLKEIDPGTPDESFKIESISAVHHKFDEADDQRLFVSSRKTMERMDHKDDRTLICENIEFFRFQNAGAYPFKITLSTYEDHLIGENGKGDGAGSWELVGKFSLDDGNSDGNAEVFRRLEDIPNYLIDRRWRKYNDADSLNGEFTVKVQNYQNKWLDPEGLKNAVIEYLTLSTTDVQALATLSSDDPTDQASAVISYLDMLRIVSLDFHVSRMLGLGHIDKSKGRAEGDQDGGDTQGLLDFINDLSNSSKDVGNALDDAAPLSEPVLIAAIDREQPLSDKDMKKVLLSTSKLTGNVLHATIDREVPVSDKTLKSVMSDNAPLSDEVLLALINKDPAISANTLEDIMEDNSPLSDEVLLALINRDPQMSDSKLADIMEDNSPLSDNVLVELINSSLSVAKLEDVLLDNTPLSLVVEDALTNRQPSMPQKKIDNILNSTFVAGDYKKRKCIYVMEYVTLTQLEDIVLEPQTTTHVYMSLPTDKLDFRLPPEPFLKPVSYGLTLDNKSGSPTELTDPNGYTLFADERIVNLHRTPFIFERPLGEFFDDRTMFDICGETPPVQYGIEYKEDTETNYRKPEINNDPTFFDHAGTPETLGIPETGFDPLFIHQETEEGIHNYAAYSINWFSRVSPISNQVTTDLTKFPKRSTLLPPSNFAVQLIQEEAPLIFTTAAEQTMLGNITAIDKTLVRATFDWNHMHNLAYQFASHVEFFFRETEPENVRGKIASVVQLPNNQVQVTTTSYVIASTATPTTVQPEIVAGEESRYEGSLFTVNGESFVVDSIISTGINPTFVLNQIRQTNSMDPDNTNVFCTTETFVSPPVDEVFMVIENMNGDNWDANLTRKVYLEHFHTVHKFEWLNSSSSTNDGTYTLLESSLVGGNTELTLEEDIPDASASTPGDIAYTRFGRVIAVNQGTNTFTVEGNITSEVSAGDTITIEASKDSDADYTVDTVVLVGSDTEVKVLSAFNDSNPGFYLTFAKTVAIASIDGANKKLTLTGDFMDEIIPAYREDVLRPDGSTDTLILGGISDTATINDIEDVDGSGVPIPGSKTGAYEIIFDNYQLPDHINPGTEWYKGIFRVLEDAAQLPPLVHDPSEPNLLVPEMKSLNIWEIDRTGTTLRLVVFDATFNTTPSPANIPQEDYVPIETGSGVAVNFHPGYRLYLETDTNGSNNFEEATILPGMGDGNKQTFMATRALDASITDCYSPLTSPAVLLALEIVEPEAPGVPTGPTFATRPDFYGKSTYTFDVEVDTTGGREPYSLIFYRANERTILDKLYTPAKVQEILDELAALTAPDADFFTDRWNGLVNVDLDGTGEFKEYIAGGFRFPIPNNTAYSIPDPDPTNPKVYPFDGTTPPGDPALITLGDGVTQITMLQAVQDAIDGSFLPLTEQPVIYNFLETGTQTSGTKPVIRDDQDNILVPGDAGFDPFPMVRKFNDGLDKVRFTDYTLDGAATNFYFYFGVELSNKLKVSDRSPISGPILLVNSSAAEEPEIKKIVPQLALQGLNPRPVEVQFELNDYIESEGIKKVEVYRSIAIEDAQSVRTMTLANTVNVGDPVIDDFSDLSIPPFGETLFYRVVALREISNEQNQLELIPSKPSNLALTNIVDNINPDAPNIGFTSDPPTSTTPIELPNVFLQWNKTTHNGFYHVYVMNASGNWTKIHTLASNNDIISLDLADTDLGTNTIIKQDDDGNTLYHRFRVDAENSSGLLSLGIQDVVI